MSSNTLLNISLLDLDKFYRCIHIVSLIFGISIDETRAMLESMIPDGVSMERYSDLSFVVRFHKPHPELEANIKKAGGKLNQNLKGGPGYIFPLGKQHEVRGYIMNSKPITFKKRKSTTWNFRDIVASFPYEDHSGHSYNGTYYKMLIPIPKDKADMGKYITILSTLDSSKTYWPSEAMYIIHRIISFPDRPIIEDAFISKPFIADDFMKEVFWIKGDERLVDNNIIQLYERYPPNPYIAYHHKRLVETGAEAYFYRGSSV